MSVWITKVDGFCPMGCGAELVLHRTPEYARLVCSHPACPRPTAVDELLAERQTEHVVTVTLSTWTVRHPLRERLDDALDACGLTAWLTAHQPARPRGRYVVRTLIPDDWLNAEWERL